MATLKCKMCGGNLEIIEGTTVCECEYCGTTQTVPTVQDDVTSNLFNRANNLRMKSEFDKAQEIYEKIVSQNENESEAYWGIVLCKFGIEYVEDPTTFKKIPTCHRTQLESVLTDVDYLAAIEHADISQKTVYEDEAKEIDNLQHDILEIVHKEEPFDVFICYKETDENGKRTQDSVIANDIYHQLTLEGFKVFYAAITLEDKLGQEYEPYIFAALTSAKVMLAIGTKPEYFSSVWVKNEWSRYLKLMKNDRSKLLIPCYRDMDAYDLPEEFSHLQAQDMSKIGFINDLIRGIKKVVVRNESAPAANERVVERVVESSGNANITPLLKRAFMFLDDCEWDSANEYAEKVLDIDPECADAYIVKLYAENKIRNRDTFRAAGLDTDEIEMSNNYKKAYKFGKKAELEEDIKEMLYNQAERAFNKSDNEDAYKLTAELYHHISGYKDADEKAKKSIESVKECAYQVAESAFNKANSENSFKEAFGKYKHVTGYKDSDEKAKRCLEMADICRKDNIYEMADRRAREDTEEFLEKAICYFTNINDYKDSAERIEKCKVRIAEIQAEKAEEERHREQQRIAAEKKAKRVKKISLITGIAAVVIISVPLLTKNVIIPTVKYNEAVALMKSGLYDEATETFYNLGDYRDSRTMALESQYNKAVSLLENGSYDEAAEIFYNLGDYKDSCTMCLESLYDKAMSLFENGSYDKAIDVYRNMGGYKEIELLKKIFAVGALKTGDKIKFGEYDWRVLDIQNDGVLVIADEVISKKKYSAKEDKNITWEECSVRNYLNGEFYKSFSEEEKAMIKETDVVNSNNPKYGTSGGNNTKDKIFILSIDEVNKYFSSHSDLIAFYNGDRCRWWLRSPGCDQHYATYVGPGGGINIVGCDSGYLEGIRPAMWIEP